MKLQKLIGSRQFYRKVFYITIPIMIQNGITNFVNMLDNIMVGRIGTEQMSGIAIVNQLLMVFNLAIFGAISAFLGRWREPASWERSFMAAAITKGCAIPSALS